MLKNKHLCFGLSLTLATANISVNTSITNNTIIIHKLRQECINQAEINGADTNATYGCLNNSTILNCQGVNGTYRLFNFRKLLVIQC